MTTTSKFSTFLDALRTKVPQITEFTSKRELPNPYNPEDNPKGILRDGWGVTISASSSRPDAEFNTVVDQHLVGIVLTREWVSTENNASTIHAVIKQLKDDATTLQRKLERGDLLAISSDLESLSYVSTSDPTIGAGERERWVYLTVNFVASIRETLI